jgi:uncharacterized protein with PQ loop repeat
MNPLVFFIALMVAFFAWILWVSLRAGEYRIKSGGPGTKAQGSASMGAQATTVIKKSEQPGVFWTLVAFNVGLILYIASIAFSLE